MIANGANVEAVNGEGFRPLHFAAKDGHLKLVESLLKHGARFDVQVSISPTFFEQFFSDESQISSFSVLNLRF